MATETGAPRMVTNAKVAKTLAKEEAGIPTEDEEGTTELEVERKETAKTVEKQTSKNLAKEVTKIEIKEKDHAPETEKTRGNEIIKKTLTKIVLTRSQNARKLPRRKAWEGFCPNFLASKTSFGPQHEVIHAQSGSI